MHKINIHEILTLITALLFILLFSGLAELGRFRGDLVLYGIGSVGLLLFGVIGLIVIIRGSYRG